MISNTVCAWVCPTTISRSISLTDEPGVTSAYSVMCRDNHQFAKFNRIGYGADGSPDPGDLHDAWVAGARAFRLTPR